MTTWPSKSLIEDMNDHYGIQVCEQDEKPVWFGLDQRVACHTLRSWIQQPTSRILSSPNRIVFPLTLYECDEESIPPSRNVEMDKSPQPTQRHFCLDFSTHKARLNELSKTWEKRNEFFRGWFAIGIARRFGPFHSFTSLRESSGHSHRILSSTDTERRINALWHACVCLWMGKVYVPEIKSMNHASDEASRVKPEWIHESRAWIMNLPQVHTHMARDQLPEYVQVKYPDVAFFAVGEASVLFDAWCQHLWTALTQNASQHQYVDLLRDTVELHWVLDSVNGRDTVLATLEAWHPFAAHLSSVQQSFLADTLGQYLPRLWEMKCHQRHKLSAPRHLQIPLQPAEEKTRRILVKSHNEREPLMHTPPPDVEAERQTETQSETKGRARTETRIETHLDRTHGTDSSSLSPPVSTSPTLTESFAQPDTDFSTFLASLPTQGLTWNTDVVPDSDTHKLNSHVPLSIES
jgi:hypothetical protein